MVVLFLSLLFVVARFGEELKGDGAGAGAGAAAGAGAGAAAGLVGAVPFLACSMAWHLLV